MDMLTKVRREHFNELFKELIQANSIAELADVAKKVDQKKKELDMDNIFTIEDGKIFWDEYRTKKAPLVEKEREKKQLLFEAYMEKMKTCEDIGELMAIKDAFKKQEDYKFFSKKGQKDPFENMFLIKKQEIISNIRGDDKQGE